MYFCIMQGRSLVLSFRQRCVHRSELVFQLVKETDFSFFKICRPSANEENEILLRMSDIQTISWLEVRPGWI